MTPTELTPTKKRTAPRYHLSETAQTEILDVLRGMHSAGFIQSERTKIPAYYFKPSSSDKLLQRALKSVELIIKRDQSANREREYNE